MKDLFTIKGASGLTSIYKGEIVKGDDTYLKRLVKNGDNFLLVSGSYETKKWKRFGRVESGDYFYMSDTYYDAVVFKPKSDVVFLGFGLLNHYEKKDFKLKFKHNIGGQEISEVEIEITQDKLGEDGQFEIDYQKLGIAPVSVKADTPIHVMARVQLSAPMRFNYGYDGYNPERI